MEDCKQLLTTLDEALEQKCDELQSEKRDTLLRRWFFALLAVFVIAPVALVLFDVPFIAYAIPALVFLVVSVLMLSPLLYLRKGELSS